MATNAGPVYGKQYIRYAESFQAVTDDQSGGVGTVEIGEFRVVYAADWAPFNSGIYAAPGDAFTVLPSTILGVNQAYMPTATASPQTNRAITVATSGLLLVETEPGSTPVVNTALTVNALGQASSGGTAVTKDGTEPTVREIITIGGRTMALVSFT